MSGKSIHQIIGAMTGDDMTPPSNSLEIEKGTVNVGDKVIALGNEYVIDLIQQGHLFSKDEKGKKLAITTDLVEEIIPQEKD